MGIFFLWFFGSLIAGAIGSGRAIGFWVAFFLSLILSPLIGIIAALVSKDKETVNKENLILSNQAELLKSNSNTSRLSVADEITKLKSLLDQGALTQQEFDRQKSTLLKNG